MSNKLLKFLAIPKQLIEKLETASIFTIKDLISKCPIELVRLLNVPLSRVEQLMNLTLETSTLIDPIDALTLFKSHQDNHVDLDTLDTFDVLLNENELLKTGILSEICGPPGVGKTQFLMKLCSTHLLDECSSDRSVIYIDTENNFNANR